MSQRAILDAAIHNTFLGGKRRPLILTDEVRDEIRAEFIRLATKAGIKVIAHDH